jgi:hypothetical protein
MGCFASLLRDYRSEVEDILVTDKQVCRAPLHASFCDDDDDDESDTVQFIKLCFQLSLQSAPCLLLLAAAAAACFAAAPTQLAREILYDIKQADAAKAAAAAAAAAATAATAAAASDTLHSRSDGHNTCSGSPPPAGVIPGTPIAAEVLATAERARREHMQAAREAALGSVSVEEHGHMAAAVPSSLTDGARTLAASCNPQVECAPSFTLSVRPCCLCFSLAAYINNACAQNCACTAAMPAFNIVPALLPAHPLPGGCVMYLAPLLHTTTACRCRRGSAPPSPALHATLSGAALTRRRSNTSGRRRRCCCAGCVQDACITDASKRAGRCCSWCYISSSGGCDGITCSPDYPTRRYCCGTAVTNEQRECRTRGWGGCVCARASMYV